MPRKAPPNNRTPIKMARIERAILVIRGHKIILDTTLAELYEVETRALVRAVRRNVARFPVDFMFQLSEDEFDHLRYQIGTSSSWGGRRYRPYAFTEQGVPMLSSVLRSARAVQVNIEIMRAFVRHRQLLGANVELARKLPSWPAAMQSKCFASCSPNSGVPVARPASRSQLLDDPVRSFQAQKAVPGTKNTAPYGKRPKRRCFARWPRAC